MNIPDHALIWGVTALISIGTAYGVVKTKLDSFMKREDHTDICKKNSRDLFNDLSEKIDGLKEEVKDETSRLWVKFDDIHGMVKEVHGYLKAKKGEL